MDLSICRKAEMPLRVPTGSERTTNTITRMAPVPYSPCRKPVRNTPLAKPRMKPTPSTVPGTAMARMEVNSIKPLALNFFLTTR